ncbi:unnamed protein product (macronuclear) [Paramecium tetraurelia]|uniref:Uncharacterized protein n=1 Tax=Paramecium tetraurelia TaxID=5888 RepID=A0BKZ9_PARTE|nr:uncharacterized protein GSPATT00029847001 [Paramecium tetraurelia]CAK59216.1 unnamed protein product [Paramecium tetraurelia]|eukprot:XP_001426614.1 hypothetical protein (macronuclear) [Paramecium tetraurelia strain d4-2]
MSSCKTNECQRPPLLALYDKISRLKSLDRILINTGSNFKAKSPQKSPDIRAILDHSKLSIERSKSSKAIDQQLNHQKREQKNDIRKEGQLLQLYLMCMHNSLQNQRLVINLQKKAKIIEPISVFNFWSQPLYIKYVRNQFNQLSELKFINSNQPKLKSKYKFSRYQEELCIALRSVE